MEQFIVSARKYRPNSFEALIGQENIARTLKNSILRHQLAHAYLFCGPRGVGKTSAARIFAKTINCSNLSEDMEPCGTCESCLSFAEGRSYSIHELDAASNNSVEDIRALTDQVRIPPQVGKYSVYIIDEVHMLSQSAFNAFLKTLEEPPAHAIFILATTEKHKILPTILSRCQTYDFNRISVENIVRNLKNIAQKESVTISDDALHIIAQKADGAMRDALTLFDQTVAFCGKDITYEQVIKNLNVLDYDYYFKLTDDFLAGDYAAAMLTFDEILSKGFNALHFISGLSTHFRDLLVCKNEASQTLMELAPTVAQRYKTTASRCSLNFLFEALSRTTACETGYKQSGNQRLLIEFTLLDISRIMGAANVAPAEAKLAVDVKPAAEVRPAVEAKPAVETKPVADAKPAEAKDTVADASDHAVAKPAVETATTAPAPGQLSIRNIMKEVNAPKKKNVEEAIITETLEFTEENILKVWMRMAENESAMPRLSSAISQKPPVTDFEGKKIHFVVGNDAQKDWIVKNCKVRLEKFIRANFGDDTIELIIETASDEDNPNKNKLYMPSTKADFLRESSSEFMELGKDLGLELS